LEGKRESGDFCPTQGPGVGVERSRKKGGIVTKKWQTRPIRPEKKRGMNNPVAGGNGEIK